MDVFSDLPDMFIKVFPSDIISFKTCLLLQICAIKTFGEKFEFFETEVDKETKEKINKFTYNNSH